MTRTTLFIASIAMGLAMALPAAAERRDRHQDRRDGKVAALAADLRKATAELTSEAQGSLGRHRSWVHWRAIYTLRSLDRQARDFQRRVQREGAFDRDTLREFRRLDHAFQRASHRVPVFKRRGVQRDFARVERIMGRLDSRLDQHQQRSREHQARHDDRSRDRVYGYHDDRPWRVELSWNANY